MKNEYLDREREEEKRRVTRTLIIGLTIVFSIIGGVTWYVIHLLSAAC